jgi:dsDNA-binding SOS-regulon protein
MSKNTKVYVVTRDGRRVEEKNYTTRKEAKDRSDALAKMLRTFRDPDLRKIGIRETLEPYKIR